MLLLALALPSLAPGEAVATDPPLSVEGLLVPPMLPGPGEPLVFRLALQGPPMSPVQLRVWLEGEGLAQVRAWNGSAWLRADRYAVAWTLDEGGHVAGWLAVRAGEGPSGSATLRVRVRDLRERMLDEASWPLDAPLGRPRAGFAPEGASAVGAWDDERLVALAPVHPLAAREAPWDLPGMFRLVAPADAALRALDADGAPMGAVQEAPSGGLRITALLVDPLGPEAAEFVRFANVGPEPAPLRGWSLAGPGWEAVLRGGGLGAGEEAALVADASAHAAATGRGDALTEVGASGAFRLPNARGAVHLAWLGHEADAVAWGDGAPPPAGWEGAALPLLPAGQLHRRLPGLPDTDSAADFDPEPWMAGWSSRAAATVDAEVAVFGREDALGVALRALGEARREVLVEVYQFTSPALAGALADALDRGVRVRLLLEGAPVGGVPEAEQRLLEALMARGAEVRSIGGSGRDRFGTVHAKFAVIDRGSLLLGSENWTPSGFSVDGRGNLGWGAWVRSEALARHFAEVWTEDGDLAREDTATWPTRGPSVPAADLPAPHVADSGPVFLPARATALLVPENARPEVLALLARANRTLDLQALDLPLAWGSRPNPVVEALRAAGARGVQVRVLLDGTPGTSNVATVDALQAEAALHGWSLEARLSRTGRVHNKAVVVDRVEALVGSINSGEAAMTFNREAALLLQAPAAERLAGRFDAEWGMEGPPAEPVRADAAMLAGPLLLLVAAAVWRGRRRRGG